MIFNLQYNQNYICAKLIFEIYIFSIFPPNHKSSPFCALFPAHGSAKQLNQLQLDQISIQKSLIIEQAMPQESVKVVVRVRPFLDREKNLRKGPQFISYDLNEKQIVLDSDGGQQKNRKIFCFDEIFTEESQQSQIFQSTGRKLVEDVLEGYNGTIFAYGQTGSGKTYTMMGATKSDHEKGITPRCFEHLLAKAKENNSKDFLIMCSFIELYNEQIRDLLCQGAKTKLELRQSPDQGLFIKDVKKLAITSEEQMTKYLKLGMQNRATAQTLMNLESSRSHSIFTIYVQSLEQKSDGTEKLIGSKFNLVDLAGSERQSKTGSTGERFVQATKINLSLTALGKVITSLVQGKGTFIPYRDSKLTRLLQDSLGGNAKTVMIATISPIISNFEQTLSTLKYASKAKYITNAPIINQDPKDALLLEYEKEIKRLRGKLNEIQMPPQIHQLKEQNQKLTKLADDQKKQLMNKIKSLEEQLISPSELSQKLLHERSKREQKLTYMEKNYANLEEEVKEMRELLTDLRRKYKNASKEIFQLENQHEKEREEIYELNESLVKENTVFKSVLSVLFTSKQLSHIIGLGNWQEDDTFKLPQFYFKDRHTLAFPCGDDEEEETNTVREKENAFKRSLQKDKCGSVNNLKSSSRYCYPSKRR